MTEFLPLDLDKVVKTSVKMDLTLPEHILGKIAFTVINALKFLNGELKIVHKNVQPLTIICSTSGSIKLGHFLSAELFSGENPCRKDKCEDVRIYMASERINPAPGQGGCEDKSDIWSLGISLIEAATGLFPYTQLTPFQQLCQVGSHYHQHQSN